MKKITFLLITLFSCMFFTKTALCQDAKQLKKERIQASYLLAVGRLPTDAESGWWMQQNDYTLPQLVESHRKYMQQNKTFRGDVVKQSYYIAFGRTADKVSAPEIEHWKARNEVFWEMFPYHVRFLQDNLSGRPDIYEDVVKNAYNFIFSKGPGTTDLQNWKSKGAKTFVELIYLLYNTPPPGYNVNGLALINALNTYKDFANISFSDAVNREILAITGGNDLYNKFKNGIR